MGKSTSTEHGRGTAMKRMIYVPTSPSPSTSQRTTPKATRTHQNTMSSALVNRSIATVKTELEFLRESNVITENFFNQVMSSLPDRYANGQPPVDLTTAQSTASTPHAQPAYTPEKAQNLVTPAPQQPSEEFVEVMYNYTAQQPEDLGLVAGEKVQVIEHTSPDWWKGTVNGKTGMFPSNYVRPIQNMSRPASVPAPPYQAAPQQQMPPQQYNNGYPVYPNNGTPFPPQQQVQQPQQQQEQQQGSQHHGSATFKKFGSKLGNAAIFGAGATIGSDIVNSIF